MHVREGILFGVFAARVLQLVRVCSALHIGNGKADGVNNRVVLSHGHQPEPSAMVCSSCC